jgi:hypothetical protein
MTMLADLVRDFRYAARSLLRTPSSTVVAGAAVSEGLWLRRLGGDPAAVGRTIVLNGSPHLVVGVVPRDFHFSIGEVAVFVPTSIQ